MIYFTSVSSQPLIMAMSFIWLSFMLKDTLKIPRATIQYSNQDPLRCYNINRMMRSASTDDSPTIEKGNDFESFSNDLNTSRFNETEPTRHSTISGPKDLTIANLARLNKLQNAPNKNVQSPIGDSEITIAVDSMTTTDNKQKENDSTSTASSTHFTMVNGFGGSRTKQPMKPVCCCNDITTLIVSMTILFMFIIFGVIIFAEYPRMMAEIG